MDRVRRKDIMIQSKGRAADLFMKIRVGDYWDFLQEELASLDEERLIDWSCQSGEKRDLVKDVKFQSWNYRKNIELEKKLKRYLPDFKEMSMGEFLKELNETVDTHELADAIMKAFFSIPALIVNEKKGENENE